MSRHPDKPTRPRAARSRSHAARHRGGRTLACAALALLLLSLTGCVRDTCSGGSNMTDPHAVGTVDAGASQPTLTIRWDPGTAQGAQLPDAYFADVIVGWDTEQAVADRIASVSLSASREITVTFTDLASYLQAHDRVAFTLQFPDRASVLDCDHPGSFDRYLLVVTLTFDAAGTMTGSTMEQRVSYGPI